MAGPYEERGKWRFSLDSELIGNQNSCRDGPGSSDECVPPSCVAGRGSIWLCNLDAGKGGIESDGFSLDNGISGGVESPPGGETLTSNNPWVSRSWGRGNLRRHAMARGELFLSRVDLLRTGCCIGGVPAYYLFKCLLRSLGQINLAKTLAREVNPCKRWLSNMM